MHPVQTYMHIVLTARGPDGTGGDQVSVPIWDVQGASNVGGVSTIFLTGEDGVSIDVIETPTQIANLINNALKGWG